MLFPLVIGCAMFGWLMNGLSLIPMTGRAYVAQSNCYMVKLYVQLEVSDNET